MVLYGLLSNPSKHLTQTFTLHRLLALGHGEDVCDSVLVKIELSVRHVRHVRHC